LLPPDLWPEILLGADLFSRILHALDVPVFLFGLELWSGVLCGRRILYRLDFLRGFYSRDLLPCILLGRPSLELI
jgi:hypothetical protein